MYKLPHNKFIKARYYVFSNCEDIDRAWFQYIFNDSDTESLNIYYQSTNINAEGSEVFITNLIIRDRA